jgi:hypothetical protein
MELEDENKFIKDVSRTFRSLLLDGHLAKESQAEADRADAP